MRPILELGSGEKSAALTRGRSRPRHSQRVYRRVARSARAMLRSRGALRGGRRRSRTAGRRPRAFSYSWTQASEEM